MKILIDIGHPAHVHYFRNFIRLMEAKGHQFFVTARDREHVAPLLNYYQIPFKSRGKGADGFWRKLLYLFYGIWHQYRCAAKFKPDLFLDFGTVYSAPVARFMGKPYVAMDDTENAGVYRKLFMPFCHTILTPDCFEHELGEKHQRFNGYMELCYLHPRFFQPDPTVLSDLGLLEGEVFVVVRFVNWQALHDVGHAGMTTENKLLLIRRLAKWARVFISSEGLLPKELENYRLCISSHRVHSVLAYAHFLVGESATMASEAAMLGTTAIFMDNVGRGYTRDLERRYDLVRNFSESVADQSKVIDLAIELVKDKRLKVKSHQKREELIANTVDVTAFLLDYILRGIAL